MYAAAVKKRLGIKTKGKGISKVFPKKEPPFKLGEITDDKEEILNAMRKKPFTIGEFRGEIYENKEMKVLAIDNAIEIIEIVSDKPMGIDEFKKMYGDSLYSVRTVYGITMVYSGFAIDVVDGYLNKIIFFKRDVF